MNTRSLVFFVFSLISLFVLPNAKALPPAKPTDGSVRFTRVSLTGFTETYHSYHLRWKDNAPDADGTEIQLRFANAGPFYFLTNGSPTPISERDAQGYREAIISVGSPPPGTICQFQIVAWKFNGSKTESSSLLIQTRVPAAPVPTVPATNNTFLAPANLTAQIRDGDDGRVDINWEDKSDIEAFHQLYVGEVITTDVNGTPVSTVPNYNHVGFIPFGKTSEILSNEIYLPFGGIAQQSPNLIPGKTYRFGLRATKTGGASLPSKTFPTVANVPAIPLTNDNVTQVMVSGNFTMPALKGPENLTGKVTGENTILLNWTDQSNNETGYEIQYRIITVSTPEFVKFADVSKNATSFSVNIGQLATAEFRVCAVYKYTPSAPAGASEIVVRSAFTPSTVQLSTTSFSPPTDLTAVTSASGISNTVDLTWKDNSSSEVGFDVFCRPTGSTEDYKRCISVPSNITKVSAGSFTASKGSSNEPIFTPLAIDNSYDFVVRAIGTSEAISSPDSNVAVAIPRQGFTSDMYAPITQGEAFTYTATTSNKETRTAITATGLPAGLGIVSSTGVISGTPTQSGRFPVTLTATFSPGPAAVSTLMLLVQSAKTSPTVAATIPNVTIRINEPLRIPLTDKFTDPDTETAVRWETNKGNIDFLLYPSLAPQAVANFMAYVNAGDYTNILVHRHVPNFVLQAGGFRADSTLSSVASRSSPLNEPGISNTQWTIAAAKRGARESAANTIIKTAYETANPLLPKLTDDDFRYAGEPNSATTDIFINLNDNAANLDKQNGGFTVFGRVATASQPVVAAITALPIGNYGSSPLNSIPINAATAPTGLNLNQVVKVNRAYAISTLRYSTDNLSTQVASISIENNELLLTGKIAGTRLVTLTATDFDNKTITQTFTITVNDSYQPPSITTQPISQAVTTGSTAIVSVTALGTDINYKWRKNGVEIIPAKTNSTLSIPDFQADDVADYDVIISNANSTLTSRKAVLTLKSPAIISGSLNSRIVEVGKPIEIEASVTGSPEPSCIWKRGTTSLTGQTSRKLLIAAAKLSDAGQYSVSASNAGGSSAPGTGGVATIIVIDKTTQYQNVKAATSIKLIAPVSGAGLTYQWKKDGVDIGISEPGFSGQQDATLIISSVTTGNIGDYTCVIEAPAGLGSAETGIIRLSVPTQKPTLASFVLPNAFAGLPYRYQIELSAGSSQTGSASKFVVSGLPSGLNCDVNTGIISGTPRSTGIFTTRLSVSNVIGSALATSVLKVSPLESATSGSYVASISPSQPLNLNLGGRLDVTLSDNSTYTASLQLGGETLRSAGALNLTLINNTLTYTSIVEFPRPNRKTVQATLILQPSSTLLQGSISDGTSTATISGYRHAWSSQYRSGPPPFIGMPFAFAVGSFKGAVTLNVALEPEAARLGQSDTPEGSGYLALTVTNSGTATAAGRLSDGTPITASTLISSSAEMYFFQALNLGTSSLGGFMELSTVNYSKLSSDLRWLKGRQPILDRIYQPGFSPTILSAYGARYTAPADRNVLKISDIDKNVLIKFSRGGLTSVDPSLSVKLGQAGGVVYPAANPSKVSLTLSPNTGLINGSFELAGPEKRQAIYQGLIIPKDLDNPLDATRPISKASTGVGHFLLPELTPTVATSAIKSGLMSMNGILITKQPSAQNVITGANVSFSVEAIVAADLTTLTYQWQKNGTPLTDGSGVSGSSSSTLSLAAVDNADAAEYKCLIKSGTEVQALSNAASLALVISDVAASRTPDTSPLSAASLVTFSVAVKGSGPLTYVWFKNGVVMPKATSSNFTIASSAVSDDGIYTVRVFSKTNPEGVISNTVNLNINPITTVTVSRLDPIGDVPIKTSVTLSASANSGATISRYQWRKDGVAIRGATASTYTFVTGSTASTNNYDVLAINPLAPSGIASNLLPLTVLSPVSNVRIIRTSPMTMAVPTNSPFTLLASASGGSLTYQWKKNNVDIPSATSSTFTFTPAVAEIAQYSVTVKNPLTPTSGTGSEGVPSAALTVVTQVPISAPVLNRTAPAGATVPFNTSVTLSVTAMGTDPTYQWFRGPTLISGATNASYAFTSGATASTTNYSVRVTNGTSAAGVMSNVLVVQVAPAP
jgi:cyclophilin family peptidyl-prolyl cis-trans isomerase